MKVRRLFVCCVRRACCAGGAAVAQTDRPDRFRGTVEDSSGGVLPGVTVTVTNVNTGIARTADHQSTRRLRRSQPAGRHLHRRGGAAGLPQGREDRLRCSRPTAASPPTSPWASGAMTETVEVEAVRGETVNRTSGEIARVIDGEQVR